MFGRTSSTHPWRLLDPRTEWTRRRLQLLLAAVVLAASLMTTGGVWSLVALVHRGSISAATTEPETSKSAPAGSARSAESAQARQDELAASPLPEAPLQAAQPGDLSSGETGTLEVPAPMEVGEAGVATGFPRTPAGALAQLAAIDTSVLTSASVRSAQEVITVWAAPGGPTAQSWSGVHAVAGLLESAGMPADAQYAITIGAEPTMGFIKGTVGDDFVVPCVNFLVTATITSPLTTPLAAADTSSGGTVAGQPQHVAAADCQRMVWREGRWMIGAGEEPAPAPSLWPGSQASFDAGYEWLEVPQS